MSVVSTSLLPPHLGVELASSGYAEYAAEIHELHGKPSYIRWRIFCYRLPECLARFGEREAASPSLMDEPF